ncbi:ribosome-associated translation inhibitor RaiA [Candidatus Parcubacteria bacterium]|nr:MAG: ribosome-associated translation inhibitor RaiA [Candidatus Parcubacteria bacterium]
MQINLKTTNIQITPQTRDYAERKVNSLEKFILGMDESVQAWVELEKTTNHHQKGDIYRAEIQIRIPHYNRGARAEATHESLNEAIDDAHDEMKIELEKIKDKKISLARRGARLFKKFIPFLK